MATPQIVDVTRAEEGEESETSPLLPKTVTVPSAAKVVGGANVTSTEAPRPKLFIATPCFGCQVSAPYLLSLMQLQALLSREGIDCVSDFVGNESLITRARCVLAAKFLKSDCTHLLFIDADIAFAAESIVQLLGGDKDIMTAIYPKKSFDWDIVAKKVVDAECKEPVEMMGLDYNINLYGDTAKVENGLVEVLDAATGMMLVKRQVLEAMAKHYEKELSCVNDLPGDRNDPGYPKTYVALFDCMIDPVTRRYLSEDYAFSRRAQALGYKVFADLRIALSHVGNYTFRGDLSERMRVTFVK